MIGDDGKTDGKIHIVIDRKQAKSIEKQTEAGNTAIDLSSVDKVTLNGGEETVGGVITSVDAQSKDTSKGAGDAGLHEEGGHTEIDANGKVTAVAWDSGAKKTGTNNASITLFNGVSKPNASELADYWHVHTSGEVKGTDPTTGQPTTTSAKRGTSPADVKYQKGMESAGYSATAIQVDTRGTDRVNFYTGSGSVTSIKYKAFKKLK
ncbi:hypothetical protein [Sinomicrobium weinanense]|uniref:Uncharacterized protein n=1 Tax=Sinomicrobium weinanense TaxID=2842200 RepID=A0A926Q1R0_9FLAO|nr:hypothetical protein [Sinomicrobium weinanense]MBC9795833.1 hypothetical protein [Sinomicrobium weinanense]MBU3125353.1 hypothetical protein [Sinomicrobium weinanense]